ncbi:MAG: sugar-binding protein, partial [Pirellulales bacterium]
MNGTTQRYALPVALLTVFCVSAHAGVVATRLGSASTRPAGRKRSAALPVGYVTTTAKAPAIDGAINEKVWADAAKVKLARKLNGSGLAPQPTEVRLLRDKDTLYLAFRCKEPRVKTLKASRQSHDADLWSNDSVEVFLGTAEGYYHFAVNPLGSTYDGRGKKKSWDSGFKAAGTVGNDEWTAEAAIPLRKMAGKGKLPKRWLANFTRNRHAAGRWQEMAWSTVPSGNSHTPNRFGELRFEKPPADEPEQGQPGRKGPERELLPCDGGEGVVRFDLSDIPENAKVFRADLVVSRTKRVTGADDAAQVDIEILPLFKPFKKGGGPEGAGKPLALRGPWFDRFDATEAVRGWAGGKPNGGFFVKTFPYWHAGGTCLEIVYEGTPKDVPQQATGLQVTHRSGQTFVTWKEISDPVGTDEPKWGGMKKILAGLDRDREIRYCIYRSTRPITADTLGEATCIAQVKPLSGWNINGRNIEKPIDYMLANQHALIHGHWNPFVSARVDGKFGRDCRMERLVIEDNGTPLARGSGLYVHSATTKGAFHYAVLTSVDGVQNTRDLSKVNSTTAAVSEEPARPQPVLQKVFPPRPFWNYPETRYHYVQFVGPPYVNRPYQYYNWSVGVPKQLEK